MTTITLTDSTCNRCDDDLADRALAHMEAGNLAQCPNCGLPFDFSPEWLVANGYEPAAGALGG